jgi:hypothetical protein
MSTIADRSVCNAGSKLSFRQKVYTFLRSPKRHINGSGKKDEYEKKYFIRDETTFVYRSSTGTYSVRDFFVFSADIVFPLVFIQQHYRYPPADTFFLGNVFFGLILYTSICI